MKTIVLPLHRSACASLTNGLRRDFRQQVVERLAVVRLVEEIDQRLGDDRPDALRPTTARPRRLRTVAARRSSSIVPKHLSRSRAVTMPTWRMPRPNRKRGPSGARLASIAASRLSTDFSFQPSRPSSSSRCSCRRKMSAGELQPAELDELGDRSSRPAPRCRARRATRNAAAARTVAPGRSGRRCSGRRLRLPRRPPRCRIRGNGRGRRKAARGSSRVKFSTTCGMTSPARWMRTRSPMRRPSRAISSRLWSVTLATITPPTPTGSSRPTGVSLPVRPTWMSIASSVVSAFSAGNLCARPQRGARADLAEPLLPVEPVDLVDHAVDVERQVRARLLDRAIMGEHPSIASQRTSRSATGNAEALDPLHRLELGRRRAAR